MRKTAIHQPPLICSEVGLVWCLGGTGISVITGTEEKGNPALYSRYTKRTVQFSSYESDTCIDELCELGRTLDYKPVIMTYDDRLLMNISENREKLLPYYRFQLPEKEMVEKLLDKMKFIDLCSEYDLVAPASVKVSTQSDLKRAGDYISPPYLIKPLYRHHWFHKDFTGIVGTYKKAYICSTFPELQDYYSRISQINPNVVVQEYIEGPDSLMYDVNMYIDANGSVKGTLVSQKLRAYPELAGYGSYVVTVDDKEILNLAVEITKKLKLSGLLNVQFKRDERTNQPKLIEIHTRTSIFDVLGIKADMNLPEMYYKDMTGAELPDYRNGKSGVKYIHLGRDLRLVLKHRENFLSNMTDVARSYFGTKIVDGFSMKDPLPVVVSFWWLFRQLLNRKAT